RRRLPASRLIPYTTLFRSMVEEHTRRTVHLRHNNALGPVDEEGAVLGHERHVAHVDILLLDIEHRAGVGFAVDFEDDQAQRDLQDRKSTRLNSSHVKISYA